MLPVLCTNPHLLTKLQQRDSVTFCSNLHVILQNLLSQNVTILKSKQNLHKFGEIVNFFSLTNTVNQHDCDSPFGDFCSLCEDCTWLGDLKYVSLFIVDKDEGYMCRRKHPLV